MKAIKNSNVFWFSKNHFARKILKNHFFCRKLQSQHCINFFRPLEGAFNFGSSPFK